MAWKKQIGESGNYAAAATAVALIIWGVYQYAAVRYGEVGLSSLNKSLAMTTLFLLGIVLILGTLGRQFALFDRFLKYRKELGVLTFYTGLVHVYLSMFPLARRGPWGLYLSRPWSAYPGLLAFIILFLLVAISVGAVKRFLRPEVWWKMQNWGARIAFILIAFHMIVLKYSGWAKWFANRNPSLPPLAMLGAVFSVFVLLVRLSEFFGLKAGRVITKISFLAASMFTLWLFVS